MSHEQISKTISHAIEEQFPGVYREDADIMVAFMKAYYEFLETQDKYATKVSRQMFETNDIDNSLEEFVVHFKEKYLADIPFESFTDKRFMNKHIMDLYRSKGSEQSIQLFMKLVYNQDAQVYYPGRDVLKPSESVWRRWPYIEVDKNSRSRDMINRQITGSISGATAFVENVNTKRVNGKIVDIMYLSSVRGNFIPGERVTEDGNLANAPKVTGSLTDVTITLGGRNNVVGDVFSVVGAGGVQGKIRVAAVEDATGRVDFEIENGGWGYSNSQSSHDSSVYVARAMIGNDNADPRYKFLDFENVVQRIEKLGLLSATDLNGDVSVGSTVIGIDPGDVEVVRGRVISVANTDANGDIIGEASANSILTVQILDGGTFDDLVTLNLATTGIVDGEVVEEESEVTFNISANTEAFTPGDDVIQFRYGTANNIIGRNDAVVVTANDSVITTNAAFGDWTDQVVLQRAANSSHTATIASVVTTVQGARGTVTAIDGANAEVQITFGAFDAGNLVRGRATLVTSNVLSVTESGATDVHLEGNTSSNGVIDTITVMDAKGFVIGQNNEFVGLFGNTSAFFTHEDHEFFVETERDKLISPPKFLGYDPVFQMEPTLEVNLGDTFTLNDLAALEGVANTVIQAQDLMIEVDVKFPTNLSRGVVFDVGGTTAGTLMALVPNSANSAKTSLTAITGLVADANSHAIVEILDEQLPIDDLFHKLVLHTDISAGVLNVYMDGILMGTANTADGSGFVASGWSDNNPSALGTVVSGHAGAPIGYNANTHGNWKGTFNGTMKVFANREANNLSVPGNIIDVRRRITSIGTGFGANFNVGIIEGTENVLVNTDLVGGNNVANVPYTQINLDGSGAGTGFIDSITVNDGGTQYANGSNVTFTGGGFAGGNVLVEALGTITTDANGTITVITMTEPGEGFYDTPTPVLPVTTGLDANVTVNMDFGYGFPELPDGDVNTILADVLQSATIEIGSIATLTRINPGADYNLDPFIRVRQDLIAGYGRRDFYAHVSNTVGGFIPGEDIIQVISGTETAKGKVKSFSVVSGQDVLLIERNSFSIAFQPDFPITGDTSGATTFVDILYNDEESRPIGDNSDILGTVIAANGIVTDVEVIDSGYGYVDNEVVDLEREGFPFIISGTSNILRQGISEGHWETTDSHLSSEKRIQDSFYYQEYSYDVISGISLSKYKDAIKQILHVSGNEIFGSISKITKIDSKPAVANSNIEIV